MSKVCLIDGSGYIFRAFYALPNMTSPSGIPVNAVYGFVTMFMRLLKNIPCDYCLVLLDAHRKNFRNDIYGNYKANRAEPPELLIPQFELIRKAIEVMGLPYIEQEGYEADDLIATYAKQALDKGYEAVIVSADKDLMQLIRPGITFYDGMKEKFFTDADVKEKFGVLPDKVVDVQALAGDKIDNIPGVPGIGLKTAAELINEFGSLQGIFDNLDNIDKPRRRELLKEYEDSAKISLQLVTLKDDIKLEHNIEEFKCRAPDGKELLAFTDTLGFRAIRPKLEKWASERQCDNPKTDEAKAENITKSVKYAKITTLQQLSELNKEISRTSVAGIALLHNNRDFCGISISPETYEGYYIPFGECPKSEDLFAFDNNETLSRKDIVKFLRELAENKSILKVAADVKTLWHNLNKICRSNIDFNPFDDISVMSYDLDSSEHKHDFKSMCEYFLNYSIAEPKANSKNAPIDFENPEAGQYVFEVGDYILRLYFLLKKRIFSEKKTFVYEAMDRPLIPVLLKMEDTGIVVNDSALLKLDNTFSGQISVMEQEIFTLAGEEFNLNSPAQIGRILYDKLNLKGKKNASGSYNTSAEVLEALAEDNEIAAKILEWRMYNKLKSTYTTSLLEARDNHNRVHTTFSQTTANTGRLASSNPNLQNIPIRTEIGRQIRGCFEAEKGYVLVASDYSQMELRLIASYANVKALRDAFAQNADIHTATASHVFGIPREQVDKEHRRRAKAINFGIIYGISQYGLAKQIGIEPAEAKKYISSYFQIMPEIKRYMDDTIQYAHSYGYVETPFGRKCYVGDVNASNQRLVAFAERAAINAPIQGGAADIVKMAMIRLDNALKESKLDAKLLLQVHDELVVEAKADIADKVAELMKNIMENVVDFSVKFAAETGIGKNWNDAH
ncbi:MAG: DNA polymerase I [Alphaproteobacteria bacterium]|nr:DNA polymerase I [Alphaproteobacteria bacterium]